jgi:hypothetical protein
MLPSLAAPGVSGSDTRMAARQHRVHETDVWYRPDGKRRVTHIHLSTVKEYPFAK